MPQIVYCPIAATYMSDFRPARHNKYTFWFNMQIYYLYVKIPKI